MDRDSLHSRGSFFYMKKTTETASHPLWMVPVCLLLMIGFIEGMHTAAHLTKDIDIHGYCKKLDNDY